MTKSADQYDQVAAAFADVEAIISFVRENLEWPSFKNLLGDLRGLRVLDVGCGEGSFTRRIKQLGAARVVGTDLSPGMIALAQQAEARNPQGIAYEVQDLAAMPPQGEFDVVTAIHVLHYADTRETLQTMANTMHANLKPGGKLAILSANANSGEESETAAGFRTYRPANPKEGDKFKVAVLTTPPTEIEVHHWPAETISDVLQTAGFTNVSWDLVKPSTAVAPADQDRAARCAKNPTSLTLAAIKQ
ncbi:class I SAM-dependent methyltransferase [Amycolatopsis rubida]|uniref:Class I SAM-dependent methyltransferase n=1 Tax=Amycolatopsis rubida TaxID=112413 RepID=A0ABX0BKP6_9PSEU|nr:MULTISPECIES: class I SAM-dependent methyltransferase [Amycolatopsis]MYW91151.1 methyltransferase domain-containing protein [Amycolatopsis rubida]NEC56136.1 class I SAM-dependent methyltransferase [Amycolatopsis rubida]OAP21000.1 Magnesium-protoporphyrin O-methyltransferase [Amycolatopsis sp. M39]